MLATVNLDDQTRIEADKIGNVGADRKLSPERRAVEPMSTEAKPNSLLGFRYRAAK
jgi:hypothetical protein